MKHTTLAGRGARLGAVLLDLVATFVVVIPGISIAAQAGYDDKVLGLGVLLATVGWLGVTGCQIYLLVKRGQTIGKTALGIRIVDQQTEKIPTWGRLLFARQFFPGVIVALPYVGWLFAFVDPLFIFREDRRCIHDLMAGTKVVSESTTEGNPVQKSVSTNTPISNSQVEERDNQKRRAPTISQHASAATISKPHSSRGNDTIRSRSDKLDGALIDLQGRLDKLFDLHEGGTLTDEEYHRLKRKAIADMVELSRASDEDMLVVLQRLRSGGRIGLDDIKAVKEAIL